MPNEVNHKSKWWRPTSLPRQLVKVPSALKKLDPQKHSLPMAKPRIRAERGKFGPSSKWVPYSKLPSENLNYIVPAYRASSIGMRYGLTHSGQRLFCTRILPPPVGIFEYTHGVSPNMWSKLTLLALDVVLRDLERLGYHRMLPAYEEHLELVAIGSKFLTDYYIDRHEDSLMNPYDKFGVLWDK